MPTARSLAQRSITTTPTSVRSRNGYTWIFGNRNPDGSCCRQLAPDFGNVLLSAASKRAWYDALFLQVDKAYTTSSRWGGTLAYTYGHATANGGDKSMAALISGSADIDKNIYQFVATDGALNRSGYSNPRLDALLDDAAEDPDQSRRRSDYTQAQQILATDLPAINLWYRDTVIVHNKRLTNVLPSPSGSYSFLESAQLAP